MRADGTLISAVVLFSLTFAVVAFVLGPAAFTPAVLLVGPAVAGALFLARSGRRRTALRTVYFAAAALFVSPMVFKGFVTEALLVSLGGGGILLSVALFANWRIAQRRQ